ncbi:MULTISPECIES: hypothetical protein [Enterococcaceae]|uniref:hypothetical protein n=1 Tax=Enterococcaceae TaxID=81852 RepID=UPI000E47186F|nr:MULTISPECIES: hypothetical protein [Enterococcaceae]RGI28520.1 hypothetical protein DXC12_09615 [Melissococcus sp. OM08-11BH]UNM89595.1 hypothetical protein MN187_00295 [Vagococcus sp. CY52-2]
MSNKSMPAEPVILNDTTTLEKEFVVEKDFIKERINSLDHDGFNIILPNTTQVIEEKKKK